jgi:hypothetical protein
MLEKYRWKKRILIIFSQDNNFTEEQKRLLKLEKTGLIERDMILFGFREEQTPFSTEQSRNLDKLQKSLSAKDQTIILIGKDGYVKSKWMKIIDPKEIFEIIDAMPMRKREMKNRGK